MPTPGDIAIIGYSSDTTSATGVPKSFSFVVLAEGMGGTVINYTDNGWLSTNAFRTGEGFGALTLAAGITAGTVVTVSGLTTQINPSTSGDQFLIYTGTQAAPSFLYAIDFANAAGWNATAADSNTSAVPQGLIAGTNALSFSSLDNGRYTGSTTGTKADILANIANIANWTFDDADVGPYATSFTVGGGGTPTANISINDVSIAEGDSGTSILTFTVTRTDTTGAFTIDYATGGGSATGDGDYASKTGTLTFAAGGSNTQTVQITVNGDTDIESPETFNVTLSNLVVGSGLAAVSDGTGVGTILNDDVPSLAIYQIQGSGHTSAYVGQVVKTTGIVTAIDKDNNAYWLQDAAGDGDSNTSDAVYVFYGTTLPVGIVVGAAVQVQGTVQEFASGTNNLTLTEIGSPFTTVVSTGNALPAAVTLGDGGDRSPPLSNIGDDETTGVFDAANHGIDFWETLEGMRVTLLDAHVTSPFHSAFNEIYVAPAVSDPASDNDRGGVTIGDTGDSNPMGNTPDFNPQVIQLEDEAGFAPPTVVTTGDQLGDVTGVVHYANGEYEVDATQAVTVVTPSTLVRETTTVFSDLDHVTVAAFNVLNLAPVGFANGEGGATQAKFDALAQAIINNLGSPTIIALEEVQDNNGTTNNSVTSASETLLQLIAAIDAAGGPHYTAIDAPPVDDADGGVGGANIRPAYLYLADVVNPTATNNLTDANGDGVWEFPTGDRIGMGDPNFSATRKSVPIEWSLTYDVDQSGGTFWTINNHFSSKGGSAPLEGDALNLPLYSEPNNSGAVKREAQGIALNAYIDGILASDPNAKIIALGDFNEFSFFPAVGLATGAITRVTVGNSVTASTFADGTAVMADMMDTLAPEERYSYNFGGRSQALDHILVSNAAAGTAEYDVIHMNSEFSAQLSDHDPSVVSIQFSRASTIATEGADVLDQAAFTAAFGATRGSLAGNDVIEGLGGDDTIVSGTGNDFLNGGAGNDNMKGGAGDDTYVVDSAGDVVTETINQGTDTVVTNLSSYTLGAHLENLTNGGSGPFTGTGNAFNNVLTGGTGADTLNGLTGNDTLFGGAGNDILTGGVGLDAMTGGSGDDTYYVDNAGDTVNEAVGGGYDTVYSTSGFTLAAGQEIERLVLTGPSASSATGNEFNNILEGNAAQNTLNGGAGADTMSGGGANDTYVVDNAGDVVIENVGEGTDTVQTTLVSYSLGGNLENLTFIGSGGFTGTGNGLANTILGGAGNDRLDGGAGADKLTGGAGDDTYVVDVAGDKVTELAGGGIDTVETTAASLSLAAEVENLTYTGAGTFAGNGNGLDNVITGGANADQLSGAGGLDTLYGLGGNDTLNGGVGEDTLVGGLGADRMAGGFGADSFLYGSAAEGGDAITDFDTTMDMLGLSAAGFGIGAIGDITFVSGAAPVAAGAGATLLYNTSTGAVLWDADGAGGSDAVLLATLGGRPAGFDLSDVFVGP